MTPDGGPGIPGWFIALFVIAALVGVGSFCWRISVARKIARDAGLDPNTATAVTMLGKDGVDSAYLASALASRARAQSSHPVPPPKTTEQRLRELQALKDKGLITPEEYAARRQKILDAI